MTQKELLYVEDAIGHEKALMSICKKTLDDLKDDDLKSFFEKEIKYHKTLEDKLISELEESSNE